MLSKKVKLKKSIFLKFIFVNADHEVPIGFISKVIKFQHSITRQNSPNN